MFVLLLTLLYSMDNYDCNIISSNENQIKSIKEFLDLVKLF